MKILIASGGTKVPIDPVRDITNMSKGTFGAKLAKAFIDAKHEVHYFGSKDGRTPFSITLDLHKSLEESPDKWAAHFKWCQRNKHLYQESKYRNYDDYVESLHSIIGSYQPDVIVLASAVSDYVVEPRKTKVKSTEDLTIQLKPAEKIIGKIKQWAPDAFLVGFKLLVGDTEDNLIRAARQSIEKNHCDLVVANDLNSLKAGKHELILVHPNNHQKYVQHLPEAIVCNVEEAIKCTTSS